MVRIGPWALGLLVGLVALIAWWGFGGPALTAVAWSSARPLEVLQQVEPPMQPEPPMLPTVPPLPTVPDLPTVPPLPTAPLLPTVAPLATVPILPTVPMLPTVSVPRPVPSLPQPASGFGDFDPQSGDASAVEVNPILPSTAACLANARIRALGPFTGYAFEVDVPGDGGECLVPAGLVLRSLDGRQDELVMATARFPASGGDRLSVQLYTNCLDVSRHGPYPGAPYAVAGTVVGGSPLSSLVFALPDVPPDQVTVVGLQAAVWAITNDVTPARLNSVMPNTPEDLASARRLLQLAGVDPASRALFKDR